MPDTPDLIVTVTPIVSMGADASEGAAIAIAVSIETAIASAVADLDGVLVTIRQQVHL